MKVFIWYLLVLVSVVLLITTFLTQNSAVVVLTLALVLFLNKHKHKIPLPKVYQKHEIKRTMKK